MPFFEDIVQLLECVDKRKVQYLLLCIGPTNHIDDNVQVIVLKTGNIRRQLLRQKIPIYNYVGEDILLDGFQPMYKDIKVTPSFEESESDSSKIDISFMLEGRKLPDELKCDMIIFAFRVAYELQMQKIYFATTESVQWMLDVFGEYVTSWSLPNKNYPWIVRPIIKPVSTKELEQKGTDFDNKWRCEFEVERI